MVRMRSPVQSWEMAQKYQNRQILAVLIFFYPGLSINDVHQSLKYYWYNTYMRSLQVPYFKQDTEYTCGPTALQMVLAYYGMRQSEVALTEQLQTTSNEGTSIQHMLEVARRNDFFVYMNNDASLGEISYLLTTYKAPSIIRYLEKDQNEDHYAVVVGLSDTDIILNDPWHGPKTRLSRVEFERRWTCDDLGTCSKWLMAVTPKPLPFGRQYSPSV